MKNPQIDKNWRVIGKSVQGSAHIREGIVRQDEIAWSPESGTGLPLIVAIADGHGGESHFRSHIGAKFAVDAAIDVLIKFSVKSEMERDVKIIQERAGSHLQKAIHQRWLDFVARDLCQNFITDEEYSKVGNLRGETQKLQVALRPVLAYGATLLCTLITHNYILYLQLGDGDILLVDKDARVSRAVQRDTEALGDETNSLCSVNAWRDFRVLIEPLSENSPVLILLSSDGISNSYRNDTEFFNFGSDYLKFLNTKGIDYVSNNLEKWLLRTSIEGSGDDITLAIVFCTGAFDKIVEQKINDAADYVQTINDIKKDETKSELVTSEDLKQMDAGVESNNDNS